MKTSETLAMRKKVKEVTITKVATSATRDEKVSSLKRIKLPASY